MPGLTGAQTTRLAVARTAISHIRQWEDDDVPAMMHTLADDPDWSISLCTTESIAAYIVGNAARAVTMAEQGLDIARRSAPHQVAESLAVAAVMSGATGDTETATALVEEARTRIGPTPSAVHLVTVVPKLALAMLDAGHPEVAMDLLERAADGAKSRFGIQPTNTTIVNLGWAALGAGHPSEAFRSFAKALPREPRWGPVFAEIVAGIGCAGVALGWEHAPAALLASDRLFETSASQLTGSLAAHVAQARAEIPWPPNTPLSNLSVDVLGLRLLQLATEHANALSS